MTRAVRAWAVALLVSTACAAPTVTLNFTFMGNPSCDAAGIDSINYTVTNTSVIGAVNCGTPATFDVSPGTYGVICQAVSDGSVVNTTTTSITVTAGSSLTQTVDFSNSSL